MKPRGIHPAREYGITIGSFGSAAGQTVMVALLPVLMSEYAPSAFWIGLAIGSEGLFAMFVPYWTGTLSDALPRGLVERFGRRSFFLLAMTPLMVASLIAVPFLHGYWPLVIAGFVFFGALHAYMTPLWALMIDAVPDHRRGRVHGVRGALQSAGIGYGLVGAGLLFELWEPLAFFIAAIIVIVSTALTFWAAPVSDRTAADPDAERPESHMREGWRAALKQPSMRWFLTANALWTGAIDGIRPYVFLFALVVLGINVAEASLVLLFLLAGLAAGAVILGRLSDHYGREHLLVGGTIVTGVALLAGIFIRDPGGAMGILVVAGLGAATLLALPFPLFATLVGDQSIGQDTGLYILSVGLARVVAPMLVGGAIDLGTHFYPQFDGYPMMWPVAGALALLSTPALLRSIRLRRSE